MLRILVALVAFASTAALAASWEDTHQDRYCIGVQEREFRFPDGTQTDCVSSTHVLEIEKSENWYEALGQALFYTAWWRDLNFGPREPGIILVCESPGLRKKCTERVARLNRTVQDHNLSVSIWDCDEADLTLAACQRVH